MRWRVFLSVALLSLLVAVPIVASGLRTQSLSANAPMFTVSGQINASDPWQTGRLYRDGAVISTCGNPHAAPALHDSVQYRYDIYAFSNNTGAATCFTVTVTAEPGTCNSQVYPVAYSQPLNPLDIRANFLGDPGSSPGVGSPVTFSFMVPAGQYFFIALNEIAPDSHCAGYTMTVKANIDKGDFNIDRKADIVLRNAATGQNALWLMNNTSLLSIVDLPYLSGTQWRFAATADFNGDGHSDLLLHNWFTGQNVVWLLDDVRFLGSVDLPSIAEICWLPRGAGDFNKDGSPDIVFQNGCTGAATLWLMNETSVISTAGLPNIPPAFKMVGVGDMNADGSPDIVIRNQSTGQIAVWLMNGTMYTSTRDLPVLANTCYEIQAIDDYNNDGKDDLVFRNTCTGLNAVWLMNNTALSSVVDLPALTNTNFEFGGPR